MHIVVAMAALLLLAPAARAECHSSASGSFSLDIELANLAGGACVMDVSVHTGADCAPAERRWGDARGCNETERMAITDRGNLVSILAPTTTRRDWPIVAVFSWHDDRVVATRIALDHIPGTEDLSPLVRPAFDGAGIRFSRDVLVSFTTLESLSVP